MNRDTPVAPRGLETEIEMSGLRAIALSCVAVVMGCFASPPAVDNGESSGTGGASESSSSSADATTVSASSSDASTVADATSSSDATSDASASSDEGSSSTGEAPCGCTGDELLCESFEPPFDPDVMPWGIPDGGADPTVVAEPVHCGDSALRAAAQPDEPFAATNYALEMQIVEPGPHRVRTWIRIEESCTDAPTRIVNIQMWGTEVVWYQWSIYTAPGGLELRIRNHNSPSSETAVAPLGTGEWHELELELDVTTTPPRGSVFVDGDVIVDGLAGPPLSEMAVFMAIHSLQFGIYRDDQPFPGGCVVYYDDVRVTTP